MKPFLGPIKPRAVAAKERRSNPAELEWLLADALVIVKSLETESGSAATQRPCSANACSNCCCPCESA